MSDYFDISHVSIVGEQGSLGPSVSAWDMVEQNFRQQFRVDSAMALDQELYNGFQESLRALQARGQNFTIYSGNNPYLYRDFARYVRDGTVPTRGSFRVRMEGDIPLVDETGGPGEGFEELRRANEAIRQLNDPRIKTFEQVLEEVAAMQRGIEEETASMSERASTGANIVGFLGTMAGSFTPRDPLNIMTAPIGIGRTVATRIAGDMALAGGTTAITEFTDVAPNRALAGLPERDPLLNIAAATIGGGLIRGGIEGVKYGGGRLLQRLGGDEFDFDLRDAQMQQMFADNAHSPSARAATSILDDTIVFERSNPYGDGMVAGYRWQAELEGTARALNGEEPTTIDLPPIPHEFIERKLSFQSVKETAPELWNNLEAARTRLVELNDKLAEANARELTIPDAVRLVDEEAAAKLDKLSEIVNDPTIPEPTRAAADIEAQNIILRVGQDKIMKAVQSADDTARYEVQNLRASQKAANKQYRAAYKKVEKEAERLEHAEIAERQAYQVKAIDVLGPSTTSEPMTGPMTRFDFVDAHGERVDAADAAQPARADAVNDLEIDPETGTVNIGTKTPVSLDFKVPFEDGELSVKQILDDLAEDQRLEIAMKGCVI